MAGLCKRSGLNYEVLSYNRYDPSGGGEIIAEAAYNAGKNIWVDISGMSRLLIVQILCALQEYKPKGNCLNLLYTEGGTYPPSEQDDKK